MHAFLLQAWDWLGRNAQPIIALLALAVAVWAGYASRRHNRLSVRPDLMQYADASENNLIFRLGVRNCGLGPARILSYGFTYQDQLINGARLSDIYTFLNNLLHDVPSQITVNSIGPRYMIPKDEKHDVLVVCFRDINQDKAREVLGRLRRLDIAIEFESIYGERDSLRPRKPGGG